MKIRALKTRFHHFLKAGLVLAFALPLFSQSIVTADAKSRECKVLENNLRRGYELVGRDQLNPRGRSLKRAIKTQTRQLKQERQTFKGIGCRLDSDGFLRAGSPRDCRFIGRNIQRMQFNLRGLQDELSFYASRKVRVEVNPTYTRRQMKKAGCFNKTTKQITAQKKLQPLPQRKRVVRIPIPTQRPNDSYVVENAKPKEVEVAAITPSTDKKKAIENKPLPKLEEEKKSAIKTSTPPIKSKTPLEKVEIKKPTTATESGKADKTETVQLTLNKDTYRTMCVRTCDGYYFEVSKSTIKSQFTNDQQACAAACPGASAELFVHRTPDGEIKAMKSAKSGIPYTMQSYAYRFRDGARDSCTCKQQSANASGAN